MIAVAWIFAAGALAALASCEAWPLFAALAIVAWGFFAYRAERHR
jgi:hypothetical protein